MIKVAVGGQGSDSDRTVAVKFDQEIFINRKGGRPQNDPNGGPWTSLGKYGENGYGTWCHVIAVDPFDNNVILAGAQSLWRTSDGGQNWTKVVDYYKPHEDQHRVLFDPTQRGVVYAANDGGVFRSTDDGVTWQTTGDDVQQGRDLTVGLITAQFYEAGISGDHAVGNAYHQGILGANSLAAGDWIGVEGHSWESSNVHGDPKRRGVFYVFAGPKLYRRHFPDSGIGPELLGNVNPSTIAVDTRPTSGVLLVGTTDGQIMRCTDADSTPPTWSGMSGFSGGNAVAIAFCPSRLEQAYALSSDGSIFVCTDGDSSPAWTARSVLPVATGTALAVSVEDENIIFTIAGGLPYRSSDGGLHWTAIPGTGVNRVPAGTNLIAITAGPSALYLAAFEGVFTSNDAGQNWFNFQENLPNVVIKDLLWTEADLFAVTHGRGLWHHGRYEYISIPPVGHKDGWRWYVELWLAIHGGDPVPEVIRQIVGRGVEKRIQTGR